MTCTRGRAHATWRPPPHATGPAQTDTQIAPYSRPAAEPRQIRPDQARSGEIGRDQTRTSPLAAVLLTTWTGAVLLHDCSARNLCSGTSLLSSASSCA